MTVVKSDEPNRPQPIAVHSLSTDSVMFDPDNREFSADSVMPLAESFKLIGQKLPGIVYPHPEQPGMYLPADGARRLMAARICGLPFLAIILAERPSKKEIRRLRVALNCIHQHMTPDQVAQEIQEHIWETKDSQEAAADFFGISPGYCSKLLAPLKRLKPELHHLYQNHSIKRCVLRIIAMMPTLDLQKQVADRVLADIAKHGNAKRDSIQDFANRIRPRGCAGKPSLVKAFKDGAGVMLPSNWKWDRVGKWLSEIAKKAEREARAEAEGKSVHSIFDLQDLLK